MVDVDIMGLLLELVKQILTITVGITLGLLITIKIFYNKLETNVKQVSGRDSVSVVTNITNFSSKKNATKKVEINLPTTKEEIEKEMKSLGSNESITQLKKEIIDKSTELSLIELIHKTSIIANLEKDKEKQRWLGFELNGYPDGYTQLPDYRKIKVRLDIGLQSHNGLMDLRKYPISIRYGGGISQVWSELERNPDAATLSFVAPLLPGVKQFFDDQNAIPQGDFNPNNVWYILDRAELDSLIEGLKHEILEYVSRE